MIAVRGNLRVMVPALLIAFMPRYGDDRFD
jgi:hypothetical protein